ncbi:MAG: hypothetical protein LCI00_25870 [Chloroflexi bacterium]|nr:hypothetical protein [Chloroflexota bacterium]MCC6895348.1 hypothetical protein [Anaerolineae bacterium]
MTDLKEFLFGVEALEIKSSKSMQACVDSIARMHQPRQWLQLVDTIVNLRHHYDDQYVVEVHKQRHFRFISMTSVAFKGNLESDASGKVTLRGQTRFQEWYYIVVGIALAVAFIWSARNPEHSVIVVLFLIVMLVVANWFARSDKAYLLNEIGYAAR